MGLLALIIDISTSILQFVIFTVEAILTVFFGTPAV
jgi:hypothetical protein